MLFQQRLVLGLAGRVDHQKQVVAEIGDHQVVEDAAGFVGEQRIALPADGSARISCGTSHSSARAASSIFPDFGRNAIWPIWETSNRPALARGVQMFLQHPGSVLHRHVVAGERHHFGPARQMQRVQWRLLQERRGGRSIGRKHHGALTDLSRTIPSKDSEKPHLSLCLRVLSRRRARTGQTVKCLFPDVSMSRGSFCLRVSGAVAPSAPAF